MNIKHLDTILSITLLSSTSFNPPVGDSYTILMPTHINLANSGSFTVAIENNSVLEEDTINIEFEDSFVLHDSHGKDDIYGTITNNNLTFTSNDTDEKTVSYNVNNASVGEWYGDLNVTISLDRVEDNGVLMDGTSINKLLNNINPTIITLSHDDLGDNYLYDISKNQDESILLYQNGDEVIITNYNDSPIVLNEDSSKLFQRITNLTTINNLNYLDTSKCTTMKNMFSLSDKLTVIDVSGWNTSNVTDMESMFGSCYGLTQIIGIDSLDYSNVTTLKGFMSGDSKIEVAPNIGSWTITTECKNLSNAFDRVGYDVGSTVWPTSIDLSNWRVDNVTTLASMLYCVPDIQTLNVTGWNTSKITNMSKFLMSVESLTTIIGIDRWNVEKVTNMSSMFYGCKNLINDDFSSWHPVAVTNLSSAFRECEKLNLHIFDSWSDYIAGRTVTKTNVFKDAGTKSESGTYQPQWSK